VGFTGIKVTDIITLKITDMTRIIKKQNVIRRSATELWFNFYNDSVFTSHTITPKCIYTKQEPSFRGNVGVTCLWTRRDTILCPLNILMHVH